MPPAAEMAQIIAGEKRNHKILLGILLIPGPAIAVAGAMKFYFQSALCSGVYYFFGLLVCVLMVFLSFALKKKFNTVYLFLIGMMILVVLSSMQYLALAVIVFFLWVSLFLLFVFVVWKDWRVRVLEMHKKGVPFNDIASKVKKPEDACRKVSGLYSRVMELYWKGRTVEEIRIELDISRSEARQYLAFMDELEPKRN